MILLTDNPASSFSVNDIIAFNALKVPLIVLYEAQFDIPKELETKARFIQIRPSHNYFRIWHMITKLNWYLRILGRIPLVDYQKIINRGGLKELLINVQNALFKVDGLSSESAAIIEKDGHLISFWFYNLLFPIALKERGLISTITSRAHRGDIYEGEFGVRDLWLRNFQLKSVERVFPISENGGAFLKRRYPKYADKITPMYLGSYRYFDQYKTTPTGKKRVFVSCSWISAKKRVASIAKLLSQFEGDFEWFHFGSGNQDQEAQLIQEVRSGKIDKRFHLMGATANRDVQKFYSDNYIDAFINLSSTEGVPVSFMEAMSYGIPILATAVGGSGELINDPMFGKLVPLESPIELQLRSLFELLRTDCAEHRNHRVENWKKHFNIIQNNMQLLDVM